MAAASIIARASDYCAEFLQVRERSSVAGLRPFVDRIQEKPLPAGLAMSSVTFWARKSVWQVRKCCCLSAFRRTTMRELGWPEDVVLKAAVYQGWEGKSAATPNFRHISAQIKKRHKYIDRIHIFHRKISFFSQTNRITGLIFEQHLKQ